MLLRDKFHVLLFDSASLNEARRREIRHKEMAFAAPQRAPASARPSR
jgi:hypothetical protein